MKITKETNDAVLYLADAITSERSEQIPESWESLGEGGGVQINTRVGKQFRFTREELEEAVRLAKEILDTPSEEE